jgi:hypothetical protein
MKRHCITLVMPLPNFANVRMHWRAKAKIVAEQRETVTRALMDAGMHRFSAPSAERPWTVTLVRASPQRMDDDGVVSSLKGVRDAIAAFVGVDDKHKHIVRYVYDDARGPRVMVDIYVEVANALDT